MEVDDGLVQLFRRIVGQHVLELSERARGVIELHRILDDIIGYGPLDELVDAIVFAVGVEIVGLPVDGRDQIEGLAVRITSLRDDLLSEELGHALDVLHDGRGIGEDLLVDALEDIVRLGVYDVGVVDVPVAVRVRVKGQIEIRKNFLEQLFHG